MFRKKTSNKGFTLIEMVVSIAIFVVVALVAVVALLKVVDANKKAQSIKSAVNNLNFALESMTRELRVGKNVNCVSGSWRPTLLASPQSCESGRSASWTIAFNSSKTARSGNTTCNLINAYYFNSSILYKGEQTACNQNYFFYPLIYTSSNPNDPNLNDASVTFTRGWVKAVNGSDSQPYVQLHFVGYSGVREKLKTYFNLQTTVSQRLTD